MSKFYCILALACLAVLVALSVGCDGGSGVCTEDGGRVSGTSETELKYPCNISAPTGATTLSGGFTNTLSDMRWLANDLAADGFVVLSFTPTNNLGMVSGWRDAHENCIDRLQDINRSHSTLQGKINKLSISGYSKGGGGALWASSRLRSTLTTTVAMAPYQEGYSDATLSSITAATLIQAGSSDTLATSSMTRGQFDGVGTSNKCYETYSGGHLIWVSDNSAASSDHLQWLNYYMNGTGSPLCSGGGGCN